MTTTQVKLLIVSFGLGITSLYNIFATFDGHDTAHQDVSELLRILFLGVLPTVLIGIIWSLYGL